LQNRKKDGCPKREEKKRKKKRAMQDKLEVAKMIPSTKMKAPRTPKKNIRCLDLLGLWIPKA